MKEKKTKEKIIALINPSMDFLRARMRGEEFNCICACHSYEWNSTTKRKPIKHDQTCCDKMNGFLV